VQNASEKIAKALQSLSEVSFVFPYTENRPKDVGDIESLLKGKLFQIEGYRDERENPVHSQKVIQS
jgi:hypothetical protein